MFLELKYILQNFHVHNILLDGDHDCLLTHPKIGLTTEQDQFFTEKNNKKRRNWKLKLRHLDPEFHKFNLHSFLVIAVSWWKHNLQSS